MAAELRVTAVESSTIGTESCWIIHQERPDGGRHIHVLPVAALGWRAAEMGASLSDVSTVLDVLLHEPYLTAAEANLPAGSAGSTLDAHVQRVARAKGRVRVVSDAHGGVDPLDVIRQHRLDPPQADQTGTTMASRSATRRETR